MVTLALDYDIDAPDCESIRTRNLLPAFWVTALLTVSHDVSSDTQLSTQLNGLDLHFCVSQHFQSANWIVLYVRDIE